MSVIWTGTWYIGETINRSGDDARFVNFHVFLRPYALA
jgi:hypothetical protein